MQLFAPKYRKRALAGSLFNGGVDAYRFELFEKYLFDLHNPETDIICGLIVNLNIVNII